MFTSEEPTRFGIGCLGSRLLGGVLDPAHADALPDRLHETDPEGELGKTLAGVRSRAGFTGDLASVKLPANHYSAWVELHIEQGPLLECDHLDLGIVTAIAAPASYRFMVHGVGGHAGALLMPDRRDALCAAAELVLAIERLALEANAAAAAAGGSGVDTVATVGTLSIYPGAVNSVPSRVEFMLDIRDTDAARRDGIMAALTAETEALENRREVRVKIDKVNADAPAMSSPEIVAVAQQVCEQLGVSSRHMISRAYHDTSFMARVAPVAMIFIPCRAGVSHRPDEYASPAAIELGTRALALIFAQLAR